MRMRDERRNRIVRALGASLALALSWTAFAEPPLDREQGLPLVSTILPIRFNTPSSPVGPQAFALAALSDSSIVVANNAGLLRLSGTQANAWNPAHGNVLSLASADDGTTYMGGIGEIGYFRQFDGEYQSLGGWAARLGLTFGDFWITLASRHGEAYFADATHVLHWDGSQMHLVYTAQPEMLQGAAYGDGVMVLDPGAGLVAIAGNDAQVVPESERLLHAGPCALAGAPGDVISVCSDGRVLHWRRDGLLAQMPLTDAVSTLIARSGVTTARRDDAGNLLVGTRRAGLFWLSEQGEMRGRLSMPEWGESRVFSVLPRHDDGFWVGLDYGVAHVEWPGQVSRYDSLLGLPRAIIATIRVNDQLLVATTRGVYRLVPASGDSAIARFEAYAPTQTTLFAVGQSGGRLFIASGEGVYAISDKAAKLDSQLAYSVFPLDADGQALLVGGLNGVRLLRNRDSHWDAHAIPDIDNEIRHFQRDGAAIWLTGNYTGVYRLRLGDTLDAPMSVEHFGVAEGLPSGRVTPLRFSDRVVFNTAQGLLRFDDASGHFLPDATMQALLPRTLGETRIAAMVDATHTLAVQHDRIRLLERTSSGVWHDVPTPLTRLPRGMDFRDVRVDADGTVWIAGNEALFRHRPELQSTFAQLPRPQLRIEGDHPLPEANGSLALGVAPRNVHATFDEAFFDGVEQLRFRTRLAPLESSWSDWQQSPQREMTQLSGGDFELAVQARDIFGRESATATAAFTLTPPWYLRWWAFALAALVFLLALAVLIRRRDRALRRRATELAELVRTRTRELEQASITDALTGLRNRHYVQLTGTPWHHGESEYWLVALVDIDHFKRVNDDRGHAVGDEVLRAVAGRLAGALASEAVVVRWGGEEFLVIVAIAERDAAPPLIRRLLHAVGDDPISLSAPPALAVTCSIGWDLVALDTTASLDMVLSNADHRLYDAKHGGRDRACGMDGSLITRRQAAGRAQSASH
jgi:diguanylate cyclase (GGDEF)-like protein